MVETEPKIPSPESPEIKKEKKKKRFFSGLRNRFLALAAAGFITLGANWEQGLAKQLQTEEKQETITEFILENEITPAALDDFRIRVTKEEPQFAGMMEEYERIMGAELDELEEELMGYGLDSQEHKNLDQQLYENQQAQWSSGNYEGPDVSRVIDEDHRMISLLRSNPESFRNSHKFLKKNMNDIIWGIALLNDSRDSREAMVNAVNPPTLDFDIHNTYQNRATTVPELVDRRWHPKITIYPAAWMNIEKKLDQDTYINVLVHEIGHAALAGSGEGKKMVLKMGGIDFATVLDEGRTQTMTYKIIRHLNRDNPDLRPSIGQFGEYDQSLVIAEIIESITRTHRNSDFLVEWQMGIIDHPAMLTNLQAALVELGLGGNIPKLLEDFNFSTDRVKSTSKLLSDLISELRLVNIDLSEEFIKNIIERGNVRH